MIFKVQKKDGSIENFSSKKIERAVSLASERIGKTLSTKEVKKIVEIVKSHLVHEVTNIVDMHKIVCNAIKEVDPDTATSYQSYRDYKTTYAKDFEKLFQQAKDVLLLGDRENANFDSALISTKGSLIRRYLTKMLYNRFYNQKDFYNELVLGTIYQHDASEAILNSLNCLKGDTWVTIRVDGKQETITLNCLKNKLNLEKGLYSLNGNIQILSHTGWTPLKGISIRSLKKEEPIYFLKTRNGLGLKATANHRIPVIDQNGKNVLKEVKDIVIGDSLIMPDKNFLEKDYDYIDLTEYCNQENTHIGNVKVLKRWFEYKFFGISLQSFMRDHNIACDNTLKTIKVSSFNQLKKYFEIPFEVYSQLYIKKQGGKRNLPLILMVTEELARLFGYIFSDGSVPYGDKKSGAYQICFSNKDKSLIDDCVNCFNIVFPDIPVNLYQPYGNSNDEIPNNVCYNVRISNGVIWDLFRKYKKNSSEISIPPFIMHGSEEVKKAFIGSAWDGDGYLSNNDYGYATCSNTFANQMVLILNSLGIKANLRLQKSKGKIYKFKHIVGTRNYDTFRVSINKQNDREKFIKEIPVHKKEKSYFTLKNKKILYRNPDKILNIHQIFEENYENILVYDLMTGDEHFIANGYIVHNCCLFDIFTVLKDGFEMNNIRYSEPNSVLTALQVIGDITLVATAQQFGGFTLPEIDRCLVPYCKKTLEKARKEIQEFSPNATHEEVEKFARNRLKRELEQGIQGIELKLNTVPCSRGDFAFVTFTFGAMPKDATEEEKDIQRLVAKTLLEVRMKGHHGVPVVFPKLVYLYSKDQHKDPKQKALFQVALECSSTTMYPDYLAIDSDYGTVSRIYKESGVITSPMGCRAFLSPWKDPKTNQYVTIGRANIGAVSLHLPLIWEVAKYNHGGNATKEYFYEYLDNCMDLIRNFFKRKYETLSNTYCSTNPMGFTQGGFYHGVKKPTEKIGDLVKYMTASFGITALHELTEVALGKSLKEDKSTFAKEVVQHIADRVKKYKSEDGWLYALYGTPAESLCETQAKQLKKFYIDTNQPEKAYQVADYLTNSFHFHVSEKISPFEKQDGEFDLFHMIEGGHIQYCRIDDPTNIKGLEDIVLRAMDMGFYEGVNFEAMFCNDCKKHSVVKPTNISTCPVCGSHATTVISRVCGYLGYSAVNGDTRLNNGKLSEIHDRVSM